VPAMGDFEQITGLSEAAVAKIGHELVFHYSRALELIKLCSEHRIAVLGIELFLPAGEQFQACGCSTYDLGSNQRWPQVEDDVTWLKYVDWNNTEAEMFVTTTPLSENYLCILTTTSMAEDQKLRSTRQEPPTKPAGPKSKFKVGSFFRLTS
jgi:hypothetical protein